MTSQIVIIEENGISKPHFRCSHCGKVITEAESANLVWNPGESDTVIICKRYACEKLQERHQGGRFSIEMDVAWFYLKQNSGINSIATRKKAELLNELR